MREDSLKKNSSKKIDVSRAQKQITNEDIYDPADGVEILNYKSQFRDNNFKQKYLKKKKELSILAKSYIYLRQKTVNPILLAKSKEKLRQITEDAKRGDINLMSSIEYSMIDDVDSEIKTGIPTNMQTNKHTGTLRMLTKFFSLFAQMVQSNLE